MSMTTPRVTVPPQALEAIAFNLCSLHDFDVAFVRENERFATAVITEYARALSAAPAPEGGAVEKRMIDAGVSALSARYPILKTPIDRDDIEAVLTAALATRELLSDPQQLEAPAEAAPCPFCGCRMRVSYDSEREMYGPDGDHLPGCIIGNWDLHEYAFRPDALAAWNSRSVRAQPPAREDAQPAAWAMPGVLVSMKAEGLSGDIMPVADDEFTQPLYTHPAPDALRVAVEAVLSIKDAADSFRDCSGDEVAGQVIIRCDQALAALQAEQKGGA